MMLRNIFRTLMQDSSAAEYASQAEGDEQVANAGLRFDNPELVIDLRRANANPQSTIFDVFWKEFQHYLDEITAVDERQHRDVLHMPLAISVCHLQELIKKRLEEKFPVSSPAIPSQEWKRLQFSPSNPFTQKALCYTGHYNMKFGIQIQQLHKDHPDSNYVSSFLRYVKVFSYDYRNNIVVISVDDKCIIPVVVSDGAVSTGVRGHNRSFVTIDGPQLQVLDHDFHVHGNVPSIAFFIDVPESNSDSFFRCRRNFLGPASSQH